ncbi:hypothetical protein [Crateriforma spongiae]|nr:hypothetical protein [Crateriforma spongiae]
MPRPKADQPGYRYHISGQAVVTFCGKNFYLGDPFLTTNRHPCWSVRWA